MDKKHTFLALPEFRYSWEILPIGFGIQPIRPIHLRGAVVVI
jgi:hypothetical protein